METKHGQSSFGRGRQSPVLGTTANREEGSERHRDESLQTRGQITPIVEDERAAEGARSALFARLRTERAVNAGRWTRDELYDDAPRNPVTRKWPLPVDEYTGSIGWRAAESRETAIGNPGT